MPQLLILAAIGAGAYFGTRWIRNKAAQITRDAKRTARERKPQGNARSRRPDINSSDADELVKDPVTGVYRVKE